MLLNAHALLLGLLTKFLFQARELSCYLIHCADLIEDLLLECATLEKMLYFLKGQVQAYVFYEVILSL